MKLAIFSLVLTILLIIGLMVVLFFPFEFLMPILMVFNLFGFNYETCCISIVVVFVVFTAVLFILKK